VIAPATRRIVPPSLQSIQPWEEGFCQVMRFSLSWQGGLREQNQA